MRKVVLAVIITSLFSAIAQADSPKHPETESKAKSDTADKSKTQVSQIAELDALDALFVKADTALKRDPTNPECHIKLGEALQARGDFSQAEKEYKLAIQLSPGRQNANALKLLNGLRAAQKEFTLKEYTKSGIEAQARKNYPVAEDKWKRALQIEPKNAELWSHLGSLYNDMKQPANAVACYQQSLKFESNNEVVKQSIASINSEYGASKTNPIWQRYFDAGLASLKEHDDTKARSLFQSSLEEARLMKFNSNELANSLFALGAMEMQLNETDKATVSLTECIKVDSALNDDRSTSEAFVQELLGDIAFAQNRLDEAGIEYRKAVTGFQSDGEHNLVFRVLSKLSDVYEKQGDHFKAQALKATSVPTPLTLPEEILLHARYVEQNREYFGTAER